MNVSLIFPGGQLATWCFGPRGDLAVGDILFAQKVALETMARALKVPE
jgi:hypothetical protein